MAMPYGAVSQRYIVRYWLLSFIYTYTHLMALSMSSQRRFVMKLIHRDSIFSPYYNPNHTIYDRAELARSSSMARYAFLSSRARNSSSFESGIAEMLPESSSTCFLAVMSFGEPPVRQLISVDTGSTLLWIQCLPCINCFDQLEQIFDPKKSSSYMNIPCQSTECTSSTLHSCDRMNNCNYRSGYMDGTRSSGPLVYEQLTFGTSDEGLTKIPKVVIGCGNDNRLYQMKHRSQSGVLGLGPGSELLVRHVGKKFSYCIGNINDHSYPFNRLALGEAARLDGYSTPMVFKRDFYLVTLEGISVGDKRLDVTRGAIQGGLDGVVIDSRATLTYLPSQAFFALKDEVARIMENGLLERVGAQNQLCYRGGDVVRDLKGFPVTTFHFSEGADLVVDTDGMFMQVDQNTFCMTVLESTNGLSVIGIYAQQYYNVGYDIDGKRIYFQRIDCEVLES